MKRLRCFLTPFDTCRANRTIDAIYEFTKGGKYEKGNPKVNTEIIYDCLLATDRPFKTISVPTPYDTRIKEDKNGAWWKRVTTEP